MQFRGPRNDSWVVLAERGARPSGHLAVSAGPGIGVDPVSDILAGLTTATRWIGH